MLSERRKMEFVVRAAKKKNKKKENKMKEKKME